MRDGYAKAQAVIASRRLVTRGLDPRVHLLRKKMDRRVKPGDDDRTTSSDA
jgi:hypothetical protein